MKAWGTHIIHLWLSRWFLLASRVHAFNFHASQSAWRWTSFLATSRRSNHPAIPDDVRILILPGFGNDSGDYVLSGEPRGSLVSSLLKRGWKPEHIRVLPVSRTDWLQVFWKGAFDVRFWRGDADATRPAYQWYLARVAENIRDLASDGQSASSASNNDINGSHKVVLLCHSAGGWLGRAVCGFGSSSQHFDAPFALDLDSVLGLVTLGSPHLPPPPLIMDMTRGALRITHENFPGSFHPSLFYITVAGSAIAGVKQNRTSPLEPTTVEGYAYNSYQVVCGNGNVVGDGVVPLCASHLDGAKQLTLEQVYHSINVPLQWYGSDSVLDSWHDELLQAIRNASFVRERATGRLFTTTKDIRRET
jgi:hypothetical protein